MMEKTKSYEVITHRQSNQQSNLKIKQEKVINLNQLKQKTT